MTLDQRIDGLVKLGEILRSLSEEELTSLAESARYENPWFTTDSVKLGLSGVEKFLRKDALISWTTRYDFDPVQMRTIGLVMAGNIPLVGFHDLLCVLISGHTVQLKLSSKDSKLITYLIEKLVVHEPAFAQRITVQTEKLENFDAVIATGSDNSSRHFEYYFRKYPHIIRKNRSSCAILTGDESSEELEYLGNDIFSYFGLGCRNVSKLYIPHGYDFTTLLDKWDGYKDIIHHHKYANNYDYQKSILLINKQPFLDNGFVLVQASEKMVSPISVLFYESYSDEAQLTVQLQQNAEKIQCVVGNSCLATVTFGQAQYPEVWDYADGIDTLKFLVNLR